MRNRGSAPYWLMLILYLGVEASILLAGFVGYIAFFTGTNEQAAVPLFVLFIITFATFLFAFGKIICRPAHIDRMLSKCGAHQIFRRSSVLSFGHRLISARFEEYWAVIRLDRPYFYAWPSVWRDPRTGEVKATGGVRMFSASELEMIIPGDFSQIGSATFRGSEMGDRGCWEFRISHTCLDKIVNEVAGHFVLDSSSVLIHSEATFLSVRMLGGSWQGRVLVGNFTRGLEFGKQLRKHLDKSFDLYKMDHTKLRLVDTWRVEVDVPEKKFS